MWPNLKGNYVAQLIRNLEDGQALCCIFIGRSEEFYVTGVLLSGGLIANLGFFPGLLIVYKILRKTQNCKDSVTETAFFYNSKYWLLTVR